MTRTIKGIKAMLIGEVLWFYMTYMKENAIRCSYRWIIYGDDMLKWFKGLFAPKKIDVIEELNKLLSEYDIVIRISSNSVKINKYRRKL